MTAKASVVARNKKSDDQVLNINFAASSRRARGVERRETCKNKHEQIICIQSAKSIRKQKTLLIRSTSIVRNWFQIEKLLINYIVRREGRESRKFVKAIIKPPISFSASFFCELSGSLKKYLNYYNVEGTESEKAGLITKSILLRDTLLLGPQTVTSIIPGELSQSPRFLHLDIH